MNRVSSHTQVNLPLSIRLLGSLKQYLTVGSFLLLPYCKNSNVVLILYYTLLKMKALKWFPTWMYETIFK